MPLGFQFLHVKEQRSWRRKQEGRAARVTPGKDAQNPTGSWGLCSDGAVQREKWSLCVVCCQ